MIQIGDKIISRDLFEKHFICHLEKCEGNCCVFGDSGAPLEDNEADFMEIHEYVRMVALLVFSECNQAPVAAQEQLPPDSALH